MTVESERWRISPYAAIHWTGLDIRPEVGHDRVGRAESLSRGNDIAVG